MPTSQILPNAQSQFIDINGAPLVGGTVAFYEPGTLVPMETWQDDAQTILNTNPIVLDSRGQATIWGSGIYRQRVKDSLGNLIWDGLTSAPYSPANPPPGVLSFYDKDIYIEGLPSAGELYPIINIVRNLTLPVSLIGSIFTVAVNPTSTAVFTVKKNGSSIGTISFATSGVPTVTFTNPISFVPFDQFSLVAPASQDGTLAGFAGTFVFSVPA